MCTTEIIFLDASYATLYPALYVGWLVCLSVSRSSLNFFSILENFELTDPAQSAPLANSITTPAHPHATRVAVYLALIISAISLHCCVQFISTIFFFGCAFVTGCFRQSVCLSVEQTFDDLHGATYSPAWPSYTYKGP